MILEIDGTTRRIQVDEIKWPVYLWCCGYEDGQPLRWIQKDYDVNDVNACMKEAKHYQGQCPEPNNRDRTHGVRGFSKAEFVQLVSSLGASTIFIENRPLVQFRRDIERKMREGHTPKSALFSQ